jgi:hypothetical protein
MPLTSSIIQRLIEAFPDESDETIKAIAKAQGFVKSAWEKGNKPLLSFGSETTQNPVGRFALQMAEGMTSPLGLGSMALSGGAALAGRAGLMGLAKGGLMAEAALNAPSIAHGAYTAGTADTMGGKAAGLLEAGFGTLGTYGPAKAFRRMNINKQNIPKMLAGARENGGVSIDPDLGDLGGQKGWAVGGMEAPERQATTSLADLQEPELLKFIEDNARPLGKPERFPGLWQDPDTGKAAMDVTTRVHRAPDAFREGILAGQKSIFDLGNFKERPTMGLPQRTRNAILQSSPKSPLAFGSPRRTSPMLALGRGELRGLAEAGDQDAISALLRLAADETGAVGNVGGMGRQRALSRTEPLSMQAARQHLEYELPATQERLAAGERGTVSMDTLPKRKGAGVRPPTTAMSVAAPGLVMQAAEESGMVDEETRNAPWYKAVKALSTVGGMGLFGMAASKGGWRGLSDKAKGQLEMFETEAAARPSLAAPKMESVGRAIQTGDFRGKGGTPRDFSLREGDIPDFTQNVNMNLRKVIRTGARKGAEFHPEAQVRLDKIMQWLDTKGLDPESIDWTNPKWKSYFNSPQEADVMARLVGALSPQKKLVPNVRDAVSVLLQRNMGIDPTQMASPFGKKHTGFGFGFADAPESAVVANLRKAMANEPIGTVYPNKVNELGEGMIGNMRALPWDMHWSRALGLKSDEPGTPLQYALMKMAGEDFMKQRGFKGAFPGMAKVWSGEKLAVAEHEPGFTELMRRINAGMPEVLRGYTPKGEHDYFETMAALQEILGGKLSAGQLKTLKGQRQPSLFDFGQ